MSHCFGKGSGWGTKGKSAQKALRTASAWASTHGQGTLWPQAAAHSQATDAVQLPGLARDPRLLANSSYHPPSPLKP